MTFKERKMHMQKRKLALGMFLAAFVTPVFAFDYSLRTECGRIAGSEYREGYHVETYSASNYGRAGTGYGNTHFRLAEYPKFTGYFWINHTAFVHMAQIVYEARAKKSPINICYRPADYHVYGVELAAHVDGGEK